MQDVRFSVALEKRNGLVGADVMRAWQATLKDTNGNTVLSLQASSPKIALLDLKRNLNTAIVAVDELLELGT